MINCKQDVDGNPIGKSNQKPILDTHLHMVEFPKREITELSANIIEELMYAQCDINGNRYFQSEAFIDYRKNGSALNVEDQKKVVGQEILKKSIACWDICCEWNNSSKMWEN